MILAILYPIHYIEEGIVVYPNMHIISKDFLYTMYSEPVSIHKKVTIQSSIREINLHVFGPSNVNKSWVNVTGEHYFQWIWVHVRMHRNKKRVLRLSCVTLSFAFRIPHSLSS